MRFSNPPESRMGSRGGARGRASDTTRALDEFDTLAGLRRSAYVLEHLATFTVTRETGIVYPADGMRRLLQLEKSNGNIAYFNTAIFFNWSQSLALLLSPYSPPIRMSGRYITKTHTVRTV